MTTPSGRREALVALIRRGMSCRTACGYLGLSRRVSCYTLRQTAKDNRLSLTPVVPWRQREASHFQSRFRSRLCLCSLYGTRVR